MNKLSIKLENCFGIGRFINEFNFRDSNTVLIYAPNGTMKTSFARTFEYLAKNDPKNLPSDRVYPDRVTTHEVLSDDNNIEPDSIFVINAENITYDASDKISSFIASKELKEKYDSVYVELDKSKVEFIKKLKNISQSSDCELEFINAFAGDNKSEFYPTILSIKDLITDECKKYDFKYNDIFDKKGNVKKFLDKNKELLQQYFDNYTELLSKSSFFKSTDNSFGTYQAKEILRSIEDNSFFKAGHKFVLDGDIDVDSAESLSELVEEEINNIIDDAGLKSTFDSVDKAIGSNAELRAFKKAIEDDNLLLVELRDYEKFKKDVWLGYFKEVKLDVNELGELYKNKKYELEEILKDAKKEVETWKNIIDVFNNRFFVPFKVNLTNQEDIILKEETANLEFEYSDTISEDAMLQPKENLLKILSKGEQRAYYILQLLFDIEARKQLGTVSLLIFDDISDSFDYKNKYAIIEYIKDLHESGRFRSIILTHNFDFYRTVASRLDLKNSVFMTIKDKNREINLKRGQYRKDVFKYFKKNLTSLKVFISLIPFVRNIIEYSEGSESANYKLLTSCLHIKDSSNKITANDVLDIFKSKIGSTDNENTSFGDKNIILLILEIAQGIINEDHIDEILLENKIVLSIAIRLKAELHMIGSLPDFDLTSIRFNQTRELFNEYKKNGFSFENIRTLDKVNLMTPENIHMNAFMYEPLIDMSVMHLIDLYKEINCL